MSSPLLTAFLALSLLCLACGNSAAVLAATGLQRDTARAPHAPATFEDEMQAWSPVLANIAVLIISTAHCLVCVASIYHLSRRVCPCFRARPHYDHNQFEPFKPQPYVVHVDETRKEEHDLCKDLERKLDTLKKKGKRGRFCRYFFKFLHQTNAGGQSRTRPWALALDIHTCPLGSSKTQACLFLAKRSPFHLTPTFSVSVPVKEHLELLGMDISSSLNFGRYVESIAKTAAK
ncbi:hypothetical protein evm_008666 [Chilo suppressalis]|nr:hypothetical protein evm_008666 [Chilo suppressalis]